MKAFEVFMVLFFFYAVGIFYFFLHTVAICCFRFSPVHLHVCECESLLAATLIVTVAVSDSISSWTKLLPYQIKF